MKVFNYSELHFAEVTFYKIHTLAQWGKTLYEIAVYIKSHNSGQTLYFFDQAFKYSSPRYFITNR